jgi:hypothetical protein
MEKKSGGQFKNFKHGENQKLWDRYFNYKLEQVKNSGKQLKTDPKMNIAQYKPGLLTLEKLTDKKFYDITAEDLQNLDTENQSKNIAYVRAFFLTAITEKWINLNNTELALYLIPAEYKGLMSAVIEQTTVINNLAV